MKNLVPLYSLTLLVGAFLLFLIQPMVGKMLLPPLGGSPAVWTTCMLFFQVSLLAGYSYAHLSVRLLGPRKQAALSLGLMALPFLAFPLVLSTSDPVYESPLWWLLMQLVTGAGLPFFVVAMGAPTLQRWFSSTDHPSASDPYFLYGASNAGSLLALLGYPFVVEPLLGLDSQATWWVRGYVVWILLVGVCAVFLWTGRRQPDAAPDLSTGGPAEAPGEILWWLALAFVPSSLMLGVTTFLTNDVAAVPLLWVGPLALYLLTFILAFSRNSLLPHSVMQRLLPFAVLLMLLIAFGGTVPSHPLLLAVPALGFFCIAMVCHGELYRRRPEASRLTAFYFWLSVGGALGGVFNGLLAPVLFTSVAEYPIVVVASCFVLVRTGSVERSDLVLPAGLLVMAASLQWALRSWFDSEVIRMATAGLVAMTVFSWKQRRVRFGLGAAVLVMTGVLFARLEYGSTRHVERNFFGIKRIVEDADGHILSLMHGNTLHGAQFLEGRKRLEPLVYYNPRGPLGDAFTSRPGTRPLRMAVIGLGTGAIASYGRTGDSIVFYEIDPSIRALAADGAYFTFLSESEAEVDVVVGDGRLQITAAPIGAFDLIVLDAFSSDAVPTHLLTLEAIEVYLGRLAPGGMLLFHISNRYLDLAGLVGNLADRLELAAVIRRDSALLAEEGHTASTWVAMARRPEQVGSLIDNPEWLPLPADPGQPVWTDQYSNVVGLLKW